MIVKPDCFVKVLVKIKFREIQISTKKPRLKFDGEPGLDERWFMTLQMFDDLVQSVGPIQIMDHDTMKIAATKLVKGIRMMCRFRNVDFDDTEEIADSPHTGLGSHVA